ncbi:RICIN domain-containing protein [Bacillus cereus]|uniref:RICIN domain-containing protein n=1 Tax=Bacillus cereus TaxID=1396 RepID=UPI0009AAF15C|nr:RICIN domain-containing protein [Bacillus cereus]PEQ68109.1 toxin [Bacillus cereus]
MAILNNVYYVIALKANDLLVWDIKGESRDNGVPVLLYQSRQSDNQLFLFFELDNGKYAIVNYNSGKCIYFDYRIYSPGLGAGQTKWTGADSQQWYLRSVDPSHNQYEIVNQGFGTVASYAGDGSVKYVDSDDANPSDPDRVFGINPTTRYPITLPTLPAIGTRPAVPDYFSSPYDTMPATSASQIVGASLIPCIMVNDGQQADYTKIQNSPYYKLIKEEYWEQTYSLVLAPNQKRGYSYTTGTSSVDQTRMTNTLNMEIGADFGLKFNDVTAKISGKISRTIQTEVSTTNQQSVSETKSDEINNGTSNYTIGYTQYQLVTKYTLYRMDGTAVSNPFISKNDKIAVTRSRSQLATG